MTEIPRRNRLDLNTPAEKAIYNAMQEVEKAGCDTRLTEATVLLAKARELVANVVDTPCEHEYKCTLDTDCWSSYTCKKCGDTKIVDFD